MIRISVLMPVYNGSRFFSRSISSVINQTCRDWELIALDDGSTDDSFAILQQLAAKDNRIKVMHKPNDPVGNTAKNMAIMFEKATGEFFFYMSQDDDIAPDCFEKLLARADDTGADIVIPDMLLRYADGSIGTWPCSYPPEDNHRLVLTGREAFYQSIDFSINGFALIRSELMNANEYDARYFDSDEYNTRMQYLRAGKVAFAETVFYYNRGNTDAITIKFSPRHFQRIPTALMLQEEFEKTFTDRRRYGKIKLWLIRTYILAVIQYFWHCREMSVEYRLQALSWLREFERKVSIAGYRIYVMRNLNPYERVFASVYFVLGSCLPMRHIYSLVHKIRKGG